jgi:hypothetical protein
VIDISTTIATIKAIAGIARDAGKIDPYNDIINLQQALLEVIADNTKKVDENARLTREMISLRDSLAVLEKQVAHRMEMAFDNNVYWRAGASRAEAGPFCPKCLDGSQRATRMLDRSDDHWWRCLVYEAIVEKPGPARGSSRSQSDWDPLR